MIPQYEEAREKIEAHSLYYQQSMGLEWMTIQHKYLETFKEPTDPSTVAETEAFWQYRSATVRWFMPAVVRLDNEGLENTVAHEFVHIIIAPIEEKIPDKYLELKEFVVESLGIALLRKKYD